MTDQRPGIGEGKFEGNLYLYSEPELLSFADHSQLGINPSARPLDFASSITVVPIALAEVTSVQRHYPIVFSDLQQPTLLAVVGVIDKVNLFIDENGEWDKSVYLPAYIRCHPFALAARPDDQFAVVIDRAAAVISENAEQPFFEGEKLSAPIQERVDFCAQFRAHRQATQAFCDKMAELGLLSGQQITFGAKDGAEGQSCGPYVAVDFDKFKQLDAEALKQLSLEDALPAVYAHRFSLDNWLHLMARRKHSESSD